MSHLHINSETGNVATGNVRIGSSMRNGKRLREIVVPRIFLRTEFSFSSTEQCVQIDLIGWIICLYIFIPRLMSQLCL